MQSDASVLTTARMATLVQAATWIDFIDSRTPAVSTAAHPALKRCPASLPVPLFQPLHTSLMKLSRPLETFAPSTRVVVFQPGDGPDGCDVWEQCTVLADPPEDDADDAGDLEPDEADADAEEYGEESE